MQKKYKRILSFIGLLILGCAFIGVAYLFYDRVLNDETEVVVIGELSANFIEGSKVKNNGTYDFSITNNGGNDVYYEILIDNLKNYESKVKYTIKSPEASLNIENQKIDVDTNVIATSLLIPAGSTQNFSLYLIDNTMTEFDILVKKITDSNEYFYATILKNNEVKKDTVTKVGEEVAKTAEGLIENLDDDGQTYYFRGAVTNNYVSFADSLWRIVRINGDGTVKLILNDDASELSNYHSSMDNYENYLKDNIANVLNNYYDSYLKNYEKSIANTKFCVEPLKTEANNTKTYNAYTRLVTNKIPTFNCLGEKVSAKIGLMTADEIIFAGANFKDNNEDFYLYNKDIENNWWASSLATASTSEFYPFMFNTSGKLIYNVSGTLIRSLRPTISLDRTVMVSGDGTLSNPYVLTE